METRPTPRDVIHDFMRYSDPEAMVEDADNLVAILAEHGYVIVHPDDVPTGATEYGVDFDLPEALGWDECRATTFARIVESTLEEEWMRIEAECANCGYSIMPDSDPPRHTYGLRACKAQPFDPDRPIGPDAGLRGDVFAKPKEDDD